MNVSAFKVRKDVLFEMQGLICLLKIWGYVIMGHILLLLSDTKLNLSYVDIVSQDKGCRAMHDHVQIGVQDKVMVGALKFI
jgi:hypothetical protein